MFFASIQKGFKKDKNRLFDRIADSFVALFASIHKDVKDKFMSVSVIQSPSISHVAQNLVSEFLVLLDIMAFCGFSNFRQGRLEVIYKHIINIY